MKFLETFLLNFNYLHLFYLIIGLSFMSFLKVFFINYFKVKVEEKRVSTFEISDDMKRASLYYLSESSENLFKAMNKKDAA